MIAPRLIPVIGTAYTDDSDCCADESATVYHVAVAPDCRLELQARIARAVYVLPRPITERAFFNAALDAEDKHFGIGNPWPPSHMEQWFTVMRRMWAVISHTQLRVS